MTRNTAPAVPPEHESSCHLGPTTFYLYPVVHSSHPSQALGKLSWLIHGLSLNEVKVRSCITLDQSHSHASMWVGGRAAPAWCVCMQVDQPLCYDCIHRVQDEVEVSIREAQQECAAYEAALARLREDDTQPYTDEVCSACPPASPAMFACMVVWKLLVLPMCCFSQLHFATVAYLAAQCLHRGHAMVSGKDVDSAAP